MTGAPYLPGFGRCGIPRLSAGHSLLATGLDDGHLHLAHPGSGVREIPQLLDRADTPNFRHAALDRTALAPFFNEARMKFAEPTTLHRKAGMWGTRHPLRNRLSY